MTLPKLPKLSLPTLPKLPTTGKFSVGAMGTGTNQALVSLGIPDTSKSSAGFESTFNISNIIEPIVKYHKEKTLLPQVLSLVKDVVQGTARSAGSVGQMISQALPGGTEEYKPTLSGLKGVSKLLFGNEPVPSLSKRVAEAELKTSEITGLPVGKSALKSPALYVAAPFIAGLTALDFTPFGGSEKSAAKALLKETSIEGTSKILRSMGLAEDIIKNYAPKFAQTSDIKIVEEGLESLKNIVKTSKLQVTKGVTEAIPSGLPREVPKVGIPEVLPIQVPLAKTILPEKTIGLRGQIPRKLGVSSYEDSITVPIRTSKEAKEAQMVFDATKNKLVKPQQFGDIVSNTKLKDISGFMGQARDVYRNFKAVFGEKFGEIKKAVLDPFDMAKGKYVDTQKSLLADLKINVVGKYGIQKGSKASAAIQQFGEKLRSYESLVKEFGETKANQIVEADKWFRQKYDTLLDEVNAVRRQIYPKSPEKIIPKRQDYYRHFEDLSNGFEGLKNTFETPAGIDPQLAGISPFTKPKTKWASFMQRRLGIETEQDAVGGFLNYIPSAAYAKDIDPMIGKFRTLASEMATATKETRNVNNFIEFLNDYANDLSGKTNAADRFIQKVVPGGRKTFAVLDWVNRRVKANVILGNLSSSIAQIFNVPQAIASAKLYSVPGAIKTFGGIFAENVPMAKSVFIKERYISKEFAKFDVGILKNTKKFAVWVIGVLDEVGTKFAWNAHYEKALAQGITDPIKYADDAARALVAGRGVGEVPLIQKSKLFQMVAPFQLEVGNVWHVMKDMVNEKAFGSIATLFVANFLMNRVAEQIRGSDVTFDPINAIYEGIKELNNEESKLTGTAKLIGRTGGEVLSNIPLGQTLASLYPEYGFNIPGIGNLTRKELFGQGDPTRFGTGLLAIKGLQDPLFKVLPSYAGSQIEKTYQGIQAYRAGEVENKAGKNMFDIEETPQNLLRSVMFGKYSTPEARQYFESLGKKKTNNLLPTLPSGILPKLPQLPKLPSL